MALIESDLPHTATTGEDLVALQETIRRETEFLPALMGELRKRIVGQGAMIERLLIGLVTGGHVLLEGVPGLAKTMTIKTLAEAIRLSFQRVQFTPDLLPADLIGTLIYNQKDGAFTQKKGPIFANLILADEINRAPAKVQSALLEAMQERQVTIGEATHPLPSPFMVMATENPIEQEGTYPLPEAQVDRFMLKVLINYPSRDEERRILDLMAVGEPPAPQPVLAPEQIARARRVVDTIYMDDKIKNYIVSLVMATRDPEAAGVPIGSYLQYGASPRATIYLARAARAHAFLNRRGHVIPDDIKLIGPDVLRHRLIISYEAEAEGKTSDDLIKILFDHVEVP
ncbi:MAG: AAA family ATPase [bacterium]|nr:AAA family ATPase [bacterium]